MFIRTLKFLFAFLIKETGQANNFATLKFVSLFKNKYYLRLGNGVVCKFSVGIW
jgi:hypothetical protein